MQFLCHPLNTEQGSWQWLLLPKGCSIDPREHWCTCLFDVISTGLDVDIEFCTGELRMPSEVAIPLGISGRKGINIQIHYNNPEELKGRTDASILRLYVTTKPRKHEVHNFKTDWTGCSKPRECCLIININNTLVAYVVGFLHRVVSCTLAVSHQWGSFRPRKQCMPQLSIRLKWTPRLRRMASQCMHSHRTCMPWERRYGLRNWQEAPTTKKASLQSLMISTRSELYGFRSSHFSCPSDLYLSHNIY